MNRHGDPKPALLDYSRPPERPGSPWVGGRRLGLFVVAALAHFGLGLLAIVSVTDPLYRVTAMLWLFPFGLVANEINPHRSIDNAIVNSIACGYVFAYAFAWWRNRPLRP